MTVDSWDKLREDCARCAESYTGQFLKKELES